MKTKTTSALHRLKSRLLALLMPVALCATGVHAQTILVNPATDGGFEMGTGSLADNGWTQVAAAGNDTWYTGNGTGKNVGSYKFPSTTNCAYISNNAGTSWAYYTAVSPNVAHIYKTITVPAGQTMVTVSFKYQLNGSTNTRLMVAVCPDNAVPTLSDPSPGGLSFSNNAWGAGTGTPYLLFAAATPNVDTNTQSFTTNIPAAFLNNCSTAKTFKLVFISSRNASGTTVYPPPAIDSVSVVSQAPVSAGPSTFTINNTLATGGTNFNNFTDAINWVNAVANCGLSNPITFNVSANQIFNENTPYITASATATNQITFKKSGTGANPIIRPNGSNMAYHPIANGIPIGLHDFGICLFGADYITFDGIDINSNNVSQTIAVEYGYLVKNASPTNGANNNTIKNTTILLDRTSYQFGSTTNLTRGIVQSSSTSAGNGYSATNASGNNNNNSYYNFTIGNVTQGIVLYGSSQTLPDQNTKISTLTPGTFNSIGRAGIANDIGNSTLAACGINAQFQYNATISNNIIQNITSASSTVDGIAIGSLTGAFNGSLGFNNEVSNNQIMFLKSTSTSSTSTLTGMRIQHDNTGALGAIGFRIYNNVVSNISSAYTGTTTASRIIRGLWLSASAPSVTATVQYEIVNNTIVIDGSTSPNLSNIVFETAYPSSVLKLRNNLFYNATGPQLTASHYIIGISSATTAIGASGSLSNYNDFYNASNIGGYISSNNNIATLSGWQTTFGVDANSISADPKLNSGTVLYPLSSSPLIAGGPTLSPPYNRDIMGTLRASGNSTIGAFEKVGDIVAPVMVDTLIMGTTSTTNRFLPGLMRVTDDGGMVANTTGKAPRLYFKKYSNADVFGANNSTTNGWKWVEASNTTSPFDFTINYSLLTSAVVFHDTIQYFFVAQDTVSTPNIVASPSAGFIGTSVSAITKSPTTPKSYMIYGAPASYVSSTTTQANTFNVSQNSTNNAILRVAIQTGAAGDSAYVTSIGFNSTISTDLADIANAKVWYTGTSGTFDAYNTNNKQFGNTYVTPTGTGALGAFTFNGAQITPPNSTVYFWLTYDLKSSATVNDSVDATVVSLTYNSISQIPTVVDPAGARKIKGAYCIPVPSGSRHISLVSFNTLSNNVGTTTFLSPYYAYYTPTGTATTTVKKGATYTLSLTQSTTSTSSVVYIDYNDNGNFEATEAINVSTNAGAAGTVSSVPVTIPCDAVASGESRMRIISYFTGSPWASACAAANGEIQDYTITIIDNPIDYISSAATQFSGNVASSGTGKIMMKLPIVVRGCGAGFLTNIRCNTTKTMNAATNILNAKLYSTNKSGTFTTDELLATVTGPNGSFSFTGFSDSLYTNIGDTNYYWITYDMKATAIANDTIDIRIDSMNVTNRYVVPANNNPVEFSLVKTLNTYTNSNVIHPVAATRTARTGQLYTPVLRVRIVGTTGGAPLQLKQMTIDPAGGGNDTLNIAGARVFYTGNSSTFAAVNQFGNTYKAVSANITNNKWNAFAISGVQDLNYDTNYFWVAYDIASNASSIDSVDADIISFTLGTGLTPTTKSVTGALPIKPNYCFMGPSGGSFSTILPADYYEEITNVTFGTINNTTTCSQTGGVGSIVGQYSDFSDIIAPATIQVGDTVRFTLTGVGNCNQASANTQNMAFVIMIDWNQNGVFDQATEVAYRSAASTTVRSYTDKLFVPCSALPGNTRMRIIYGTGSNAANALLLGTVCGNTGTAIYLFGETEDYTVNVVNNPTSNILTSFAQQTGSAGAGVSDVPVLRVAVKSKGCGSVLNAMRFTYTGTALADITSAKLYTTGTSSTFNNSTLVGTVSPAASMLFTGLSNGLTNNNLTDSNYFWLTYDLAASATATNTLDAKMDSLSFGGTWYNTVAAGNPAGNKSVAARMAFSSTAVTHPDLTSVATGTTNRVILRVDVTANSANGPVPITALSFNVNGGGLNSAINIDSARVYYTGTSTAFATTNQFGSSYSAAPGTWGSFTISGNLNTTSATNIFWLVYDIKSSAAIYDSVDAEFTGVTFDGVVKTPTASGAPAGNIKIRGPYCQSTSPGTVNGSYYILTSTTIGGVTNSSTTRVVPFYVDYTTLAARSISKGPNAMSVTINDLASTGNVGGYTYVYIDFDQNGDFSGANEMVASVATPFYPSNTSGITNFSYVVPCNVKAGTTRMRVMTNLSNTAPPLCGLSANYGETEDYLVTIQESPLTYVYSAASQTTGTAIRGGTDQVIMNIKVRANGCGTPLLTNMYFNTIGSNNPTADIVSAKLYQTGTSTSFNNSKLIGTVFSPNGQFNFVSSSISDTLVNNDTTNYWLVYDISGTANNNDTVDVRVDSIIVLGTGKIPSTNNPAGLKKVLAPLTLIDVSASYPPGDRVAQGTSNYQALLVRVIASSSGASLPVTSLNFNTNGGGRDINNLVSARVYYTGSSKTFATTTPFGATYTPGSNTSGFDWLPFSIKGYQDLAPDTNYFWLTFNVSATGTIGDSIDAEVPTMIINGTTQTVNSSAPAGNAIIRQEYCFSANSSTFGCIDTARIGTIFSPSVGACASYTNYPKSGALTTSVNAGASLPISLIFSSPTRASVFIDLNKNGIFETGEEYVLSTNYSGAINTSVVIPSNAALGDTRLRLRTYGGQTQGGTNRACSDWNQSETEDYTITILPALAQTTYTWNNSGTSDFALPSNWTPARASASPNDILKFNAPGVTLNISNVFTQTVSSLELSNRTTVNMNAPGTTNLQVTGTLTLNDSSKINGNTNLTVEIGESTGNNGTLVAGQATGINAKIKRWFGPVNNTNVLYPFYQPKGTRSLIISYTFAPLAYGSITASFVPTKALGNFGFPLYESGIGADLTKTSYEGYWNIEPGVDINGGVYQATFTIDSILAIPNPYNVTVVNRPDAFNPWVLNGYHSGVTLQNKAVSVTRYNMQGFGQFAFAADSLQNPLPVSLLSLTAKAEQNNALVQWSTASEVNNAGFDLERSADGKSFEKVIFVKGYGNSTVTRNYAYNDEDAFAQSNILYYRLKQLDADGRFTYSRIVKVTSNMQKAGSVSVFPNPFNTGYNISINVETETTANLTMTDIQGRTVANESAAVVKGNNTLSLQHMDALQSGVYFLKVDIEGEIQVIKLIKQ
jgi:hypothetical protein